MTCDINDSPAAEIVLLIWIAFSLFPNKVLRLRALKSWA